MYVNFYQACVFIERDNIEFLIVPLNDLKSWCVEIMTKDSIRLKYPFAVSFKKKKSLKNLFYFNAIVELKMVFLRCLLVTLHN